MISFKFLKNWLSSLTDEQLDNEAAIVIKNKRILIDKVTIDFESNTPILEGDFSFYEGKM